MISRTYSPEFIILQLFFAIHTIPSEALAVDPRAIILLKN